MCVWLYDCMYITLHVRNIALYTSVHVRALRRRATRHCGSFQSGQCPALLSGLLPLGQPTAALLPCLLHCTALHCTNTDAHSSPLPGPGPVLERPVGPGRCLLAPAPLQRTTAAGQSARISLFFSYFICLIASPPPLLPLPPVRVKSADCALRRLYHWLAVLFHAWR